MCLFQLLSQRRGLRSPESPRLRGFLLIVEDISSALKPLSGQDKAPGNMRRADVRNGSEPPHLNPLGPLVLQGHSLDIPTWRKHYWTGAELKSTFFPYTHSNQQRRRTAFIHSTQMFSCYIFLSLSHSFTFFFSPEMKDGSLSGRERAKACWKFSWWACLKLLSIAWSIFDLPQYYHSSLPLFFLFPRWSLKLHSLLKAAMHSSFSKWPCQLQRERKNIGRGSEWESQPPPRILGNRTVCHRRITDAIEYSSSQPGLIVPAHA